jgi:phosphate transport system substrate-binding protein
MSATMILLLLQDSDERLVVQSRRRIIEMFEKRTKKLTLVTTIIALLAFSLTINAVQAAALNADTLVAPNEVQVEGSSTVYPISLSAETAFEAFTGKSVVLASVGSGTGLNNLRDGLADVAASSKVPEVTYFSATGLEDMRIFAVGRDGVAIIVPASNTWLLGASSALIADIFRGTAQTPGSAPLYQYWDQVPGLTGAPHTEIDRVTRHMDDGTHDGFNTYFMKAHSYDTGTVDGTSKWLPAHQEVETNAQMISTVAANPDAIGYLGMGFIPANPTIKGVSINGVTPVESHVVDGTYKNDFNSVISRWLWYATSGIPTKASDGIIKAQWISFVKMHPEYISENGYINILRSDFTGGANTPDTTAPLHKSMPDGKVNFNDIVYFVDAYIAYNGASHPVDPYCDFNADKTIDFTDIVKFVDGYIPAPH